MRPFLQFRLWARRGPRSERLLGSVSVIVALGLVIWALVPSLGGSASTAVGMAQPGVSGGSTGSGATIQAAGSSLGTGTGSGSATPSGAASASEGGNGSTGGGPTSPGASGSIAPVSASGGSGGGQVPLLQASSSPGSPADAPSGRSTPGAGPAGASSAAAGCAPTTSTNQGVSASQVSVAVLLPDAGPVNSYVGIPSQADFQKAYNAVFGYYNKMGGVQCRQIVPHYYDDNVLDSSSEQSTCLQVVQAGPFAVLNNFDTPEETGCIAQHHIPNLWYTPAHEPDIRQFYPYLLSDAPNYDRLIENYVIGARTEGFFKGMKKLGILEETCFPDENSAIAADLEAIGITSFDTYNYGCPVAVDTPDQDQEAALHFQSDGVTNVLNTAYTYITDFAQAAQEQGYYPHMAVMEDGAMGAIAHESSPPPPSSFNGALGITWDQIGAESTPGVSLSPATGVCASLMTSLGFAVPTAKGSAAGAFYGDACAVVSVFVSAAEHDIPLVGTGLAGGMARSGPLDLSYPVGPMDVTNAADPTGGDYWRADTWSSGCDCWHVTDPVWHT
jgi:hypothetical protein